MLILYSATSLNWFISSNIFNGFFRNFLSVRSYHQFHCLLSCLGDFSFFSLPLLYCKDFDSMLNKSDKNGHLCLILDLREEGYNFSPLSAMFVMALFYVDFILLKHIIYIPICWVFLSWKDAEFYQMLLLL
jgi:hypothetical protein